MKRVIALILTGLLSVSIFTAEAVAQKKKPTRKRPTATKTTPASQPTQQPLSGAEIISRAADDYVVPSTPVQQPTPEKTPTATVSPEAAAWIKDLQDRINKLETAKKETYEDRQKRLLLNLDILTRAEQRSESLRKQIFELTDKENSIRTRLDQIDYESRPEVIERILQMSGSLRPEEIRDAQRKKLAAEKANLQSLLANVQTTKAGLQDSLDRADQMVVKLRDKLEKDIDDSFLTDKPDGQ